MKLDVHGTEYYRLRIQNEPEDLTWSASFDGGTTYVAGTFDEDLGLWKWLLSGPNAAGGGGTVVPKGTVIPLIKATVGSESVVRTTPTIKVL